jgi:hypothetical protein
MSLICGKKEKSRLRKENGKLFMNLVSERD